MAFKTHDKRGKPYTEKQMIAHAAYGAMVKARNAARDELARHRPALEDTKEPEDPSTAELRSAFESYLAGRKAKNPI